MIIILRKMNASYEWEDFGSEIQVQGNNQAMELVYQQEDRSGGRDSFNYRVVEH